MTNKLYISFLILFFSSTFASETELDDAPKVDKQDIGNLSLGDLSKEKEANDGTFVEGIGMLKGEDLVKHPKFGIGKMERILEYETGVQILRIEFEQVGLKNLVASHANLERIE